MTTLQWLGVVVGRGGVYECTAWGRTGRWLGSLDGARAEVTGGQAGRRRSGGARAADAALAASILGPAGLLAAVSRKGTRGTAFVIFANGTTHGKQITDAKSLIRAQADAVRFNALASAAGNGPEAPVDRHVRDAERLRDEIREPTDHLAADKAAADRQAWLDLERKYAEHGHDHAAAAVAGNEEAPPRIPDSGVTGEIERLSSLHASGALTDAEFRAAKAKILGL